MKKYTTRTFVAMIVAVLAVACGITLGACSSGPSAEELIREDLTTNLDEIKNLDDEAMDELVAEMGDLGLGDYGIGAEDLITSMIDGFGYSIDSIDVEEDTATASVTVTAKSMSELMDLDYDAMSDDILDAVASGEVDITDEDAINAWAGEYIMGIITGREGHHAHVRQRRRRLGDGRELRERGRADLPLVAEPQLASQATGASVMAGAPVLSSDSKGVCPLLNRFYPRISPAMRAVSVASLA